MKLTNFIVFMVLMLFAAVVSAQLTPDQIITATDIPIDQIFTQAAYIVTSWKTIPSALKVSALIFFFVALTKNSFLRIYIWDKLKWAKGIVVQLLVLIGFAFTVTPFSLKTVAISLVTGAGLSYLADMIKSLRDIPKLGPAWVKIIDAIGNFLGKPKPAVK